MNHRKELQISSRRYQKCSLSLPPFLGPGMARITNEHKKQNKMRAELIALYSICPRYKYKFTCNYKSNLSNQQMPSGLQVKCELSLSIDLNKALALAEFAIKSNYRFSLQDLKEASVLIRSEMKSFPMEKTSFPALLNKCSLLLVFTLLVKTSIKILDVKRSVQKIIIFYALK